MAKACEQKGGRSIAAWALAALVLAGLAGCQTANEVVLREKASMAMRRGDNASAKQRYQKLVEMNPASAKYQYGLGATHLAAGELHQARLALERAWRLAPNRRTLTPRILNKLATTYYRQNADRRLRNFLAQTVKDYPTPETCLRQARYLRKIGDVDGARTAYKKAAVYADDDNPEPYLAMADFYRSIGDKKNAERAVRYAHHVAPRDQRVASRMQRYGIQPGQSADGQPVKPTLMK